MALKKSRRPASKTSLVNRSIDLCKSCSTALRWRKATPKTPHVLKDYGFPVKIVGAEVATCGKCRSEHAAIGRSDRFQRAVIEQVLAKPGPLSGDEIFFLRKSLRLTGANFAGLVGVSREHVSHIEQGRAPYLGTSADRLARLMIAAKSDPSLAVLKKLIKSLDHDIGTRSRRSEAKHHKYSVDLGARRK